MIIVIIISTLCSVSASVLFLITHCTSPWVRFQPNDLLCVATENWQRNGKKQQQNIKSKQFESNAFSFNEFSNWIDSVRVASSSLLLLYRIFHLEHQSFGRLFQNALAKCAMPIRWQLFFFVFTLCIAMIFFLAVVVVTVVARTDYIVVVTDSWFCCTTKKSRSNCMKIWPFSALSMPKIVFFSLEFHWISTGDPSM